MNTTGYADGLVPMTIMPIFRSCWMLELGTLQVDFHLLVAEVFLITCMLSTSAHVFPSTLDALKLHYRLDALERYPITSRLLPSIPNLLSTRILSDLGSVSWGKEVVFEQRRALLRALAFSGSMVPNGMYFPSR